jgi:hypothetical protein
MSGRVKRKVVKRHLSKFLHVAAIHFRGNGWRGFILCSAPDHNYYGHGRSIPVSEAPRNDNIKVVYLINERCYRPLEKLYCFYFGFSEPFDSLGTHLHPSRHRTFQTNVIKTSSITFDSYDNLRAFSFQFDSFPQLQHTFRT